MSDRNCGGGFLPGTILFLPLNFPPAPDPVCSPLKITGSYLGERCCRMFIKGFFCITTAALVSVALELPCLLT